VRSRPARGQRPQIAFAPHPTHQFRLCVFDDPRAPWRESAAEAKQDAIRLGLASWDESEREHFLAVPVRIERRKRQA